MYLFFLFFTAFKACTAVCEAQDLISRSGPCNCWYQHIHSKGYPPILHIKGALCSFGEAFKTRNFYIYNNIKLRIQTHMYIYLSE